MSFPGKRLKSLKTNHILFLKGCKRTKEYIYKKKNIKKREYALENNKVIAIQHRPPKKNKTKGKVEKNSNKLSDLRRKKKETFYWDV